MTLTHSAIKGFLQDEGVDIDDLDESTPLFSSNLLDSFKMVDLILLIEKAYGFRIGAADLTLENFDSISRIEAFIKSKQTVAS
jgi:acyl carrier protein